MTLYDEYRQEFPIAAEPSEFRGIIEAEVRRALRRATSSIFLVTYFTAPPTVLRP